MFDILCHDCIDLIISRLSGKDMLVCRAISKQFREIITSKIRPGGKLIMRSPQYMSRRDDILRCQWFPGTVYLKSVAEEDVLYTTETLSTLIIEYISTPIAELNRIILESHMNYLD
jgi:hypothetical protein